MRRVLLVALLLSHLFIPLSHADVSTSHIESRDAELDVIGLNTLTVHRGELIEVLFTLHNLADADDTYSFDLMTQVDGLITTGLPCTTFIESGFLRQVKFNISAEVNAEYGAQNLTLDFSSQNSPNWNLSKTFEVRIAPYSNLNFGASDVSSFIVTPGTRTSVAMNITNNASFEDEITFNLYTQTEWNWGWTMDETDGVNAFKTVPTNSVAYIFLWIDVPPIANGMPLFGTGPRFQLTAVSSIDGAVSRWSFDLLMEVFYNASIDMKGDDAVVNPGGVERVSVDVRNNGNSPNYLNMTLEVIDSNGVPIDGMANSDRITFNDWTVALFDALEDQILLPNETRTVKIAFQAPLEYFGEMDIRLRVFAGGAVQDTRTVDVGASIGWERSGEVQLITDNCRSLLPNETCQTTASISNTGNAVDSFSFVISEIPNFVDASLLNPVVELGVGETDEFVMIEITANSSALAFQLGDVVVETYLLDTETLVGISRIPVKVAPVIQWNFTDIIEETNNGRLSIAMTLRNEGNTADGLIVQLESSHSTPMSFIPPTIAIYEDNIEYPRSFEVREIPIGYNFTVRAWIDLPQDQQSNGTVWVNTTVRSQYEPSTVFTHTSTGDYIGEPWQDLGEEDTFDFAAFITIGVEIFKGWFLMICAVLFSCIVIYKSILSRNKRIEDKKIFEEKTRPLEVKSDENWMEKFAPNTSQATAEPSTEIDSNAFKQAFLKRSGEYKQAPETVNPELTKAATTVLEFHTSNEIRTTADSLLADIQTGKVAKPHIANQTLRSEESDNTQKKNQDTVPLPSRDDDFDI